MSSAVNVSAGRRDQSRFDENTIGEVLSPLVGPLLDAPALQRLESISFLGALSPRYAKKSRSPLLRRRTVEGLCVGSDGSRRSHSLGVAIIALLICRNLGLNETQQRYAVAWGLVHDLANWPLSHSAQHAFSTLLGVDTKSVRDWLITDDERAPRKYRIGALLTSVGIEPQRLVRLLRRLPDAELKPVHSLFRCKLTPDMLEGVWRSSAAFGLPSFDPKAFEDAFSWSLFGDLWLEESHYPAAIAFWRAKSRVYRRFFSCKSIAFWESAWCAAVLDIFAKRSLSLECSLDLDEDALVDTICKNGIPKIDTLMRWKAPVRQRLEPVRPRKMSVDYLDLTFIEEPVAMIGEHSARGIQR